MDLLDFFLQKAGIEASEHKDNLKFLITRNTLGLAITKIYPHLPEDERLVVDKFCEELSPTTAQNVQNIFMRPEYQEVMADAALEVLRELIDDPEFMPPNQRELFLTNLEAYLAEKLSMATTS